MAKKSKVEANERRKRTAAKYAARRALAEGATSDGAKRQ